MNIPKATAADIEKVFREGPEWVSAPAPEHEHKWAIPRGSGKSYQDQMCTICGIKRMQAAAPRIPTRPGRSGGGMFIAAAASSQQIREMISIAPLMVELQPKQVNVQEHVDEIIKNMYTKGGIPGKHLGSRSNEEPLPPEPRWIREGFSGKSRSND